MSHMGLGENFIHKVHHLYSSLVVVSCSGFLMGLFPVEQGTQQESPLSPPTALPGP